MAYKICPICKTEFDRPSGKSDKVWEKQVCCGRNCSSIFRRKSKSSARSVKRRVELTPGERRYLGYVKGHKSEH